MAQKAYSVICNDAGGAAPQSLANLIGSTAVRPRVYEFNVGSSATPADQAANIVLARTTAAGTAGSSPTPAPLDNAEVAAVCTAGIAHSAEPTYGTPFLFQCPLNQRASFRWVAAPDSELIGTASASNGLGLKRHASTASYACTGVVLFRE
jgi:hypothetical protein